jgi:hypothetical protein
MGSNNNLVDVKSIMWLLERFLRNATDKERAYVGLEVNRIFLNLQSDSTPKTSKPKLIPSKQKSEPSDLMARLQITEEREAINADRKKKGKVQFV